MQMQETDQRLLDELAKRRIERAIRRKALFDIASAAHLASHKMEEFGASGMLKVRLRNIVKSFDAFVKEFEQYSKRLAKADTTPNAPDAEAIIDAMHTAGALLYEVARWQAFLTPENAEQLSKIIEREATRMIEDQKKQNQ